MSSSLQGPLYLLHALQVKIPAPHHAAFEILRVVGAQCVKVDESPFPDDDESGSIGIEYITAQVWTKFNLRGQHEQRVYNMIDTAHKSSCTHSAWPNSGDINVHINGPDTSSSYSETH